MSVPPLPPSPDRRTLVAGAVATALTALLPRHPTAQEETTAELEVTRSAPPGATGFVYSGDEHGASISAIDLASGQVSTVPVPISPHNVQITADGGWLLAVGEAAGGGHGGAGHGPNEAIGLLLVFETGRLSSGPVASIPVGTHPAHVVVDREGRRAFVTNSGDDTVSIVDLARKTVLRSVSTGRYPHGLRINPNGGEAYVANVEDGTVSVLDTLALVEVARIPVGAAPVQVGFTPDGERLYVSLRDENRVAVIDTRTREVLARIEVGRNPIQVHATPDGRYVYVANQGTETDPDDTVSVIEVASGQVVDTIRTGTGAHGVAVSNDGSRVFVTNIADSTVSVIDTASRKVAATIPVGKGPNGVTFQPGAG